MSDSTGVTAIRRVLFFVVMLAGLVAQPSLSQERVDGTFYEPPATVLPQQKRVIRLGAIERGTAPLHELWLRPEEVRERLSRKRGAADQRMRDREQIIGVTVPLTALDTAEKLHRFSVPEAQPDGAFRTLFRLRSIDAERLRVSIRVEGIDERVTFHFFSSDGEPAHVHPITAAEIYASIRTNRESGADEVLSRTWWSPSIAGDTAVVMVHYPDADALASTRIAIGGLSHILVGELGTYQRIGSSTPCNLDVSCHIGTLGYTVDAVAGIVLQTDDGYVGLCTGTLLNDTDSRSSVPYFLTAHHCVASQTEASSVEAHWFWQSRTCNNLATQDVRYVTTQGGADLLYMLPSSDTTLLRFRGVLPQGVWLNGWNSSPPAVFASVMAVHHPNGDLKKFSHGAVRGFWNCSTGNPSFSCTSTTSGNGSFIEVGWNGGTSEGGSSGAALLSGREREVVGVLKGGNSSCTTPNESDFFGRFDIPYRAGMSQWLNSGARIYPEPANGWWWNADESGRGFAIERQGSSIYLAGFMYEPSGLPVWYSAALNRQADGRYEGALLRYRGGQFITGAYRAPTVDRSVANVLLQADSSTTGRLTIRDVGGGTDAVIALERFPIAPAAPFAQSNASFNGGWWWSAERSGQGYFIETQGNHLFVAMFAYTPTGEPTWYAVSNTLTDSQRFAGRLDEYGSGQSLLGSYRPASVTSTVGNIVFESRSGTTATLTLPNGQTIGLERFRFGD